MKRVSGVSVTQACLLRGPPAHARGLLGSQPVSSGCCFNTERTQRTACLGQYPLPKPPYDSGAHSNFVQAAAVYLQDSYRSVADCTVFSTMMLHHTSMKTAQGL